MSWGRCLRDKGLEKWGSKNGHNLYQSQTLEEEEKWWKEKWGECGSLTMDGTICFVLICFFTVYHPYVSNIKPEFILDVIIREVRRGWKHGKGRKSNVIGMT